MTRASKPPRRRRTAEEAHAAILEAAKTRLIEGGPDSIRLQDVAAAVGVSHPTILHHFGSREGLVEAVIEHVQRAIFDEVFAALGEVRFDADSLASLLDRIASVVAAQGNARVLYWLALSGLGRLEQRPLGNVVDVTHELRRARSKQQGVRAPSKEDTRFLVMLTTFALSGESVLGADLFGPDADPGTPSRFRAWFAALLAGHLQAQRARTE